MEDGVSPSTGIVVFFVLLFLDIVIFGFLAAMQNLNEASVLKKAKDGDKKAGRLMHYLDKTSGYTHICQLLTLAVHMTMGLVEIPLWKAFFFSNGTPYWLSVLQSILIFAALMILTLIFGIYFPEKLAAGKANQWALALVTPFRVIQIIFSPLVIGMDFLSGLISRLFGVDPSKLGEDVTEEEIISMVKEGHEQGVLLASEAEMIHNIFEFGDKEAKDIMTHRKNIIAMDGMMTFLDMLDFLKENNYSRFPVYLEDINNIIGVLHIKEALAMSQEHELFERPVKDIQGLVREVDFIPETRNINNLFKMMQTEKTHMVIVVDEYGQTSGIVAMEDILEEIVGNIEDEHDEEEKLIEKLSDGSYLMAGMTPVEDAMEALGAAYQEEDEFETLNGLLISLLDKIPNEEEEFKVSAFGYLFEVLSVENKMIKSVRVQKLPEEAEAGETDSPCQNREIMVE